MQTKFRLVFLAGLTSAVCTPAVFAAPTTDVQVGSIESSARAAWRMDIAHIATPSVGCFHASYPSIVWKQAACGMVKPTTRVLQHEYVSGATQTATSSDYTLQTGSNLITEAVGTFPTVSGLTSEKTAGEGASGKNEYAVELNTQLSSTTSACDGHSGCTVWQQWLYETDYVEKGQGAVFMQDWLIGFGSSKCPSGFSSDGEGDCYAVSSAALPPDIPPTQLASLKLTATATSGGNDTAVITYDGDAYSTSQKDSTLHISQVWNTTEFNVFGAGGAEAIFNSGTSITVNIAVNDGSTSAPACVADSGSSGENNLVPGSCTAVGGSMPAINFIESN